MAKVYVLTTSDMIGTGTTIQRIFRGVFSTRKLALAEGKRLVLSKHTNAMSFQVNLVKVI